VPPRWAALAIAFSPLAVQAAVVHDSKPPQLSLDSTQRHVGAFYYLWWSNPSHDPDVLAGNWRDGTTQRSLDGNYTVSAAKLRNDFRNARSNGIDLVVTSFHEYDLPLIPAALGAAYEQDIAIAPLVELGEVSSELDYGIPKDGLVLDDRTADGVEALASKAIEPFRSAPAAYRPDGKLAVFLYDAYFTILPWRPPFTDRLLHHVIEIAAHEPNPPARADLEGSVPVSFAAMLQDTRWGPLWRRGYVNAYREFWKSIRARLEERFGPLYIVSGESWNPGAPFHRGAQTALEDEALFDATFIYGPSFVWVLHKGDSYERNWQRWVVRNVLQAQYARGVGQRVVGTACPSYDDRAARRKIGFQIPSAGPRGSTYDLTWQLALDVRPDLVLVTSWNEFFEGSAIEPTKEYGESLLHRTREWSAAHPDHRAKRGLIVTGEWSSHFSPGVADPTVHGRYAHNLQVVAERDLPDYSFDAIDATSQTFEKDLSSYSLILVEPGLRWGDDGAALAQRIAAWVRRGGHLLVSGAIAGTPWQELTGARGAREARGATRLKGTVDLPLPPATRPEVWDLPDDARILFRYADGDAADAGAVWMRPLDAGRIVGTSMHVTGRDTYPDANATLAFCSAVRPLLADDDRCTNPRPDVIP
jgi:hypothetical protein